MAFKADGTFKDIHDIPKDLRRAISGIEVSEVFEGKGKKRKLAGYIKKIKFWSKDKQIEVLMKHLGLFGEDNKQTGQTLASAVHQALKDKS
jgi:phage terminase small subunit